MKKLLIIFVFLLASHYTYSQSDQDQNGWRTSVTNILSTNSEQAMRYEVTTLGYNSYHWQIGGLIIIELFHQSFSTGYERYTVENGYGQGVNHGNPSVKLVESTGAYHLAKISIGNPYDLGSSYSGYPNKGLPIYLDVRYYGSYKVKITYLQDKVDALTGINQIKINPAPTGIAIPDFSTSSFLDNDLASAGRLMVVGNGDHYIENGNLGIGTKTPKERLSVNGKIRAHEIKVETANWPDYVFAKEYQLPSLAETEKHIKDKGHLEGIPSAKDVQANGIDLGEMNAKLLQKIEELTLHLIEKDSELTRQKGMLNKQQLLLFKQQEQINSIIKRLK